MADTKISALTAATSLEGNEDVPIVQSGANKRSASSRIGGGEMGSVLFTDFESSAFTQHTLGSFNDGGGLGDSAAVSSFGVNSTEKAYGVLQLSSGTSTAGGSFVSRGLFITFGFGFELTLEFRAAVSALSDGTETYTVFLGFNDATNGNGVDGAYFRYTHGTNGGRIEAVTRSNSVETAEDTGVSFVAGEFRKLKIVVNEAATQVDFYIDDVKTNDITTNIINDSARMTNATYVMKKTAGSTARLLYLDYAKYIIQRTTAR